MYLDELLESVAMKQRVIIHTYSEPITGGRVWEVSEELDERMKTMEVWCVKVLLGALDITVKEE